ncbi:TPR domain-containing protein [Cryptosporidium ubiquitum]|uniref:TPR domain-containing protein n=1 Tax=Cryptosporidium ubiquitum TaxID=857276 RepID=A0A1J4MGE7_9CRYT|nr:TPR domain-containing protein [Cryptosporidium ubiquitum]OII71933.1 TPR domain-containing protein [Cryptosporidium ubiquitum]
MSNNHQDLIFGWEERLVDPSSKSYLRSKNLLSIENFERLLKSLEIAESYSCFKLINDPHFKPLISPLIKEYHSDLETKSLENISQNVLDYYLNYILREKDQVSLKIAQFEILCLSILLLNIYMQSNWTGPPFKVDDGISKDWKLEKKDNVCDLSEFTGIITESCLDNDKEFGNNYYKECTSCMEIDGEYLYQKCNSAPFLTWSIFLIEFLSNRPNDNNDEFNSESNILKLSKYIILGDEIPRLSFINFWKQRFYRIWQRSLEGGIKFAATPYLESVILENYSNWLKDEWKIIPDNFPINDRFKDNLLRSFQFDDELNNKTFVSENLDKNVCSIFLLDLALSLSTFSRANPCAVLLKQISLMNGFRYSFTGALGQKRMNQRESTAQLVVQVYRNSDKLEDEINNNMKKNEEPVKDSLTEEIEEKIIDRQFPENVLLNTVDPNIDIYENVKLDDDNNNHLTGSLAIIEQCVLLIHGVAIYETSPTNDVIAYEQLNALTNRILKFDITKIKDENLRKKIHNWLCFSTALWYRCYAEHHRSRTADRACLQLQSLVDQFNDTEPGPEERLRLVFSVNYPNIWEAKKELGIRMMRIGSVLSAYNMFVEMCMWEDAVDCLIVADRKNEAIELVKEQLKVRETPRLYCSLGDLTQDLSFYEKSWELSHHRFARAQRSLGNAYFKKSQFELALEAYTKASSVNSTNVNCWFSLGCVALRLEKWETAQQAFSRVVSLDPQQGEAWANLAAALSKKELWDEAQSAINEGLKHSRDNWMMWDSSLKIAIKREDLNRIIECLSGIMKLSSHKERFPMWSLPNIINLLKSEKYINEKNNSDKPYSMINKSLNLLNQMSQYSSKPVVYFVLSEIQILKNDFVGAYSSKMKELRGSMEVIFNEKISSDDKEKYFKDIPNIYSDIKEIISKCNDSAKSNEERIDEVNMVITTIIKRLKITKPAWSSALEEELYNPLS